MAAAAAAMVARPTATVVASVVGSVALRSVADVARPSSCCRLRLKHSGRSHRPRVLLKPQPRVASLAASVAADTEQEDTWQDGVVDDPFAELGLTRFQTGVLRVRQHVNPFISRLQVPIEPPDWTQVYRDPNLPLVLDVGSGSGRFLLLSARRNKQMNYLGLDIRGPLIERSNEWVRLLKMSNVHFLTANANVTLPTLLKDYPKPVQLVSVQCPDPHFKRKHRKRRVVQPEFVKEVMNILEPGGKIFLQSDLEEVAFDMCRQFETHAAGQIEPAAVHRNGGDSTFSVTNAKELDGPLYAEDTKAIGVEWLRINPLGIPTEREHYVLSGGGRMHRALYVKVK
eukprot:jgi/Chlat1/5550/Chrsp369S05350